MVQVSRVFDFGKLLGDESKAVSQLNAGERNREGTIWKESGEVESRRNTFLGCLLVLEMQRRLEESRRFSNLEREKEREEREKDT